MMIPRGVVSYLAEEERERRKVERDQTVAYPPLRADISVTVERSSRSGRKRMSFPSADEFLVWVAQQNHSVILWPKRGGGWNAEIYDDYRE